MKIDLTNDTWYNKIFFQKSLINIYIKKWRKIWNANIIIHINYHKIQNAVSVSEEFEKFLEKE